MAKTILKVLYFVFAALIAVVFAIMTYRSNAYTHIYAKTQEYIKNKQYAEIARTYCGYFDDRAIELNVPEKNSEFNLTVFNGTQEEHAGESTSVSYYFHDYSRAYYFILTDVAYNTNNITSDTVYNKTGIRFYDSVSGKTYDYKFRLTEEVNAKEYKTKAKIGEITDKKLAKEAAILDSERELIDFNKAWGFYRIIVTENLINSIESRYEMDIDGFNLLNNDGELQYKSTVSFGFDFSAQFYTDINQVKVAYDSYFPISDGYNSDPKTNTKEEYDSATQLYRQRLNGWADELKANPTKYEHYKVAYEESEVIGGAAIGPTIGTMAIYLVVIFLLYILLFEFKHLRMLVTRFRDRNKERYIPNKMPEKDIEEIEENTENTEEK